MMPVTAILWHELRTLQKSWIVRAWLLAAFVLSLLVFASNPQTPSATLVAQILLPFLVFPWFLMVMMIGINPVTGSRSESLADGMLCRPITRSQFLLGSWAARVTLVLGIFLVATVPWILIVVFADRPVDEPPPGAMSFLGLGQQTATVSLTLWGTAAAVGLVGLVLIFQVSLAFMLGTLLRHPLGTIGVLLLIWYPLNFILGGFRLEEFSTVSLSQAIPTLAKTQPPWVEEPEEEGVVVTEEMVADVGDVFSSIFSSGATPQPKPEESDNFWEEEYEDFSLAWVLAIYGMLSAGSLGVAMLRFSRGDL